ncbi:uncharacterized protein LOC135937652 [Cloeon dipterum]|uniref:uncharacterized protein LOC135937652 n=1 Tax=Cloeon dipterum TaxID=197152 RepID=UPI0032209135
MSFNALSCSEVDPFECCVRFKPLRAFHEWKFEKRLTEAFGEDLTKRSVLQDISDHYFQSNQLMTTITESKSRAFLESELATIVLAGLLQLEQVKPKSAVEWMADWLTLHEPATRTHN